MPRPYAVKWLKKKRKRDPSYAESESEEVDEGANEEESLEPPVEEINVKRKQPGSGVSTGEIEEKSSDETLPAHLLPGLPLSTAADQKPKPGVIFILEKASLNVGKVGKVFTIA